jgi:hypothetical protein
MLCGLVENPEVFFNEDGSELLTKEDIFEKLKHCSISKVKIMRLYRFFKTVSHLKKNRRSTQKGGTAGIEQSELKDPYGVATLAPGYDVKWDVDDASKALHKWCSSRKNEEHRRRCATFRRTSEALHKRCSNRRNTNQKKVCENFLSGEFTEQKNPAEWQQENSRTDTPRNNPNVNFQSAKNAVNNAKLHSEEREAVVKAAKATQAAEAAEAAEAAKAAKAAKFTSDTAIVQKWLHDPHSVHVHKKKVYEFDAVIKMSITDIERLGRLVLAQFKEQVDTNSTEDEMLNVINTCTRQIWVDSDYMPQYDVLQNSLSIYNKRAIQGYLQKTDVWNKKTNAWWNEQQTGARKIEAEEQKQKDEDERLRREEQKHEEQKREEQKREEEAAKATLFSKHKTSFAAHFKTMKKGVVDLLKIPANQKYGALLLVSMVLVGVVVSKIRTHRQRTQKNVRVLDLIVNDVLNTHSKIADPIVEKHSRRKFRCASNDSSPRYIWHSLLTDVDQMEFDSPGKQMDALRASFIAAHLKGRRTLKRPLCVLHLLREDGSLRSTCAEVECALQYEPYMKCPDEFLNKNIQRLGIHYRR